LFDATIELHAADEKSFIDDFLIRKWTWILHAIKVFNSRCIVCICSGGIYHIKLKSLI